MDLWEVDWMTDNELVELNNFFGNMAAKTQDEIDHRSGIERRAHLYAYLTNGGSLWWPGSSVYHTHPLCSALGLGKWCGGHVWPKMDAPDGLRQCRICEKLS